MAIVKVQSRAFDSQREALTLNRDRTDIGALVTFTGFVRDHADCARIESLTLEHYPAMTERMLNSIAAEAEARWPLQACLIIHRYGKLNPGDPIVLVATAAAHRRDAFDAAAFLMDWLKTRAPFWKQEKTTKGTQWVDARDSDDRAAERWSRK